MKSHQADLIMLLVTLFWGSSYLFMQIGLDSVDEFTLIALRFGIAFLLTFPIFFRHIRSRLTWKTMLDSMLLGFLLFAVFASITFGLRTTTTSNAGFLVSLTVVLVPFLQAVVLRSKVERTSVFSSVIALLGIAFLTLRFPLAIDIGDLLCIAGAFFYASHIVAAGTATKRSDPLSVGVLQLGFAGLFGCLFAFLFGSPSLPKSADGWIAILALSVLCSAIGFVLQLVAQKYTSPARMSLIFSLEPVFAAVFAYLFADESLNRYGCIGAALVLSGVLLTTPKKSNSLA